MPCFASLESFYKRTGRTEVGASSKSCALCKSATEQHVFLDQFGSVGLFLWSSNVEKIDQTPHKAAILSAFLAIYNIMSYHIIYLVRINETRFPCRSLETSWEWPDSRECLRGTYKRSPHQFAWSERCGKCSSLSQHVGTPMKCRPCRTSQTNWGYLVSAVDARSCSGGKARNMAFWTLPCSPPMCFYSSKAQTWLVSQKMTPSAGIWKNVALHPQMFVGFITYSVRWKDKFT